MATVITTRRTKEMLLNELEAKNAEIKDLKKELEKVERYKQYEEAADEIAAARNAFINAGFTKAEATEMIKLAMTGAINSSFKR